MFAQAIHIFLKDTRRLAYVIVIALFFTATGVVRDGSSLIERQTHTMFALLPVAIAWWFLTVTLILGEPLVGDRQFWLTRPYRRASLVVSKCLFLIAFIQLPVLVTDIAVLLLRDFAPWEYVTTLLAHQIGVACILAPAVAVACVSRNLTNAVLCMLGLVVAAMLVPFVAFSTLGQTDNSHWYWWIRSILVDALLILGVVAVVYLQLWRRTTLVSLCIIAGSAIVGSAITNLPPRDMSFRLSSAFRKPSDTEDRIRIAYLNDPGTAGLWKRARAAFGETKLVIPLSIAGVPTGSRLRRDFSSTQLFVDGTQIDVFPSAFEIAGEKGLLMIKVKSDAYQRVAASSGRLRVSLYLSVIKERELSQTTIAELKAGAWSDEVPCLDGSERSWAVLSAGQTVLQCRSPLQQLGFYFQRNELGAPPNVVVRHASVGILPSWKGVSLMSLTGVAWQREDEPAADAPVRLVEEVSVAEIKRTIDIEVPRLADLAQ